MTLTEFLNENARGPMFLGQEHYARFNEAIGSVHPSERRAWNELLQAYRIGRAAGNAFRVSETFGELSCVQSAARRAAFPASILLDYSGPRSVTRATTVGDNQRNT